MWKSFHLSFLECYRVWVWRVWSFSSVIFGREVICPLLNQKANSCRDSLERPGSHSKRRAGCLPRLGSEAFSLSGKSCAFPGHLLAPSSGLLSSCSLTSLAVVRTGSSWLGHPRAEQGRAADLQPDGVCGGGLFSWMSGQLLTAGSLCACRLGCTEAAH